MTSDVRLLSYFSYFFQNNCVVIKVICIQHLFNLYCWCNVKELEYITRTKRTVIKSSKKKYCFLLAPGPFIKVLNFVKYLTIDILSCMFSISPFLRQLFFYYFLALHHLPLLSSTHVTECCE